MAETMVYTCDICKASKCKNDLARITVKTDGIRMKDVGYSGLKIDICPDCLRKKGFVVDFPENKDEQELAEMKNKATLEDKIYDFLVDMGVAFTE
jgi:hypothetical protein